MVDESEIYHCKGMENKQGLFTSHKAENFLDFDQEQITAKLLDRVTKFEATWEP